VPKSNIISSGKLAPTVIAQYTPAIPRNPMIIEIWPMIGTNCTAEIHIGHTLLARSPTQIIPPSAKKSIRK
jgi:hypothetical protein